MLTKRMSDLLIFINGRMSATGIPPSFDEMKIALGLKSKSGIHRLIVSLVERGFIKRLPHRARALKVIRLPDGPGATPSDPGPIYAAHQLGRKAGLLEAAKVVNSHSGPFTRQNVSAAITSRLAI